MKSVIDKKNRSRELLLCYQEVLRKYLKSGSAANLKVAVRLGRRAIAWGFETLDLALIHEDALSEQVVPPGGAAVRARFLRRSRAFFAEAIVPLEAMHRVALEANVHLTHLNRRLERRTVDLSDSNRFLKKEIAKRKAIEKMLRQSKRNTSLLLEQSQFLQKRLRNLSRGILLAQEEDRKSISRELHDVIAQVLTGINVQLAVLKKEVLVNTHGLDRKIARTQRLVIKSVDIVHRFARKLRPAVLDDLGLVPALESFIKDFSKETGVRVSLTAFDGVEKLNNVSRTTLYRVAHEALTNVARHAHASRVTVKISRLHQTICLDISDNGRGLSKKRTMLAGRHERLGLIGLRERLEIVGGKFNVESAPGKGTTIHAQIPFRQGNRGID